MPTTDTAAVEFRIELAESSREWTATIIVSSPSFPSGKSQARIGLPQTFHSREDALQHGLYQLGSMVSQQVGAEASMR